MADPIAQTGFFDGCDGIAATNYGSGVRISHCFRQPEGALRKVWQLEDTHRTIPNHRSGIADDFAVGLDGIRTDVHDAPTIRNRTHFYNFLLCIVFEAIRDYHIHREA